MVTPRIVIDARMVGDQGHGFARYVSLMAKGLRDLHSKKNPQYELHFLVSKKEFSENRFYGFKATFVSAPFLSVREIFEIPKVLKRVEAAVYHSPTFSSLLYPTVRSIQTIHDLNHLRFGGFVEKIYYQILLKPFARMCEQVLTVSSYSQLEIARWLNVDSDLIQIVSNAIDRDFIEKPVLNELEILNRFQVKAGEYFFCLSNSKPHKNLSFLCESYENSAKKMPLLLSVKERISENTYSVGALGDSEVRVLLKNARAVFFPSVYEGFGLPPVEAAAFGTPVVVSDIPPHQEALAPLQGEGVLFLPLNETQCWSEAFNQLGESNRVTVSQTARVRLLDAWSVEKLAENMHRIYTKLC